MIDINLWRELSLFEKYGTLSKVSEELFISQPALSRSMNKLEKEIGVTIFTRSKNKIELNDNGKLAARYANEIIRYEQNAINAIRAFDKKEGIYLSELNNQNVLLYSEIGFWYKLVKDKAPNANFLIQHDNNTFNTLLNTDRKSVV